MASWIRTMKQFKAIEGAASGPRIGCLLREQPARCPLVKQAKKTAPPCSGVAGGENNRKASLSGGLPPNLNFVTE